MIDAEPNSSNLSRRGFLVSTGASLAAMCSMGSGCKQASQTAKQTGRAIPVGLQLYSVRQDCQKDFPGTIAAVAQMGYQGVEFAGYYNYHAKDIRKMLDDNGLKCCGTHTGLDTLSGDNLPKTIEFNQTLGNKYLIVPWLDPKTHTSRAAWLKTANLFNELAEKVKPHGMRVGYHNHAHDFTPIEGETPWDILFSNTSQDVIMQLDTGNALHGGGDPVIYLKRYPGRAVTVHLKEFSATNKNAILGEGDINWKEVFALCETVGGTEWYIIEEEKDVYPPLRAAELCLKNFRKLQSQ
jgi:sugar phosphate isomerase/epimerase